MDQKKIISYLVISVLFYTGAFFLFFRRDRIETNYEFGGVVQKIRYSDKHTPKVLINGEFYDVTFPTEDFQRKIEQGDSLTKKKNSRAYKLIKRRTGEVVFSR